MHFKVSDSGVLEWQCRHSGSAVGTATIFEWQCRHSDWDIGHDQVFRNAWMGYHDMIMSIRVQIRAARVDVMARAGPEAGAERLDLRRRSVIKGQVHRQEQ